MQTQGNAPLISTLARQNVERQGREKTRKVDQQAKKRKIKPKSRKKKEGPGIVPEVSPQRQVVLSFSDGLDHKHKPPDKHKQNTLNNRSH